jgi:hypothetical protein
MREKMTESPEKCQDRTRCQIEISENWKAAQATTNDQHGRIEQEGIENNCAPPEVKEKDDRRLKAVPPEACRLHFVI